MRGRNGEDEKGRWVYPQSDRSISQCFLNLIAITLRLRPAVAIESRLSWALSNVEERRGIHPLPSKGIQYDQKEG